MKNYAVIGKKLGHTFSPHYFQAKFKKRGLTDHFYQAIEVSDLTLIKEIVKGNALDGFNVTIPYKQAIIPYLDAISVDAAAMNSVNTVLVREEKMYGENTDHVGFKQSIIKHIQPQHRKALIFGTGGSSKAVMFALKSMGITCTYVSHSNLNFLNYDQITPEIIHEHKLLVNTTPLGMYPSVDARVDIPYKAIDSTHLCFDLIYNPEETFFLRSAKAQGADICNGFDMLQYQADKSWEIWNR